MSSRPLSLFGEEFQPEQLKAVGKSRAVPKKKAEPKEEKKETVKREAPKAKAKKEFKKPDTDGLKSDKQYYSIGEVATMFHVKTSNIRFWTKEFDMKVRTTRKGDRLYNPEQVKELRAIYSLVKENGYTISGAKQKLKSNKKTAVGSVDLKQSLLQLRNKLLQIRNKLA
jgi:DNA-binding transcriptional MerR regulator